MGRKRGSVERIGRGEGYRGEGRERGGIKTGRDREREG
jgi:hypothetical protein